MNEQLVLGLKLEPALSDADFFVTACNAAAHRLVMSWPDWPAPVCILYGPRGSGKTHLAHIWRARSGARLLPAAAFTAGLAAEWKGAAILEDADCGPLDETGLFHLMNLARERNFSVLLTARAAPGLWPLSLPDLRSRIRSFPAVAIAEADDELITALAVKLFSDRQLTLSPDALHYLVRNCERSPAALAAVVAEIDRASLAAHKRLTKAFISAILREREADGGTEPADG